MHHRIGAARGADRHEAGVGEDARQRFGGGEIAMGALRMRAFDRGGGHHQLHAGLFGVRVERGFQIACGNVEGLGLGRAGQCDGCGGAGKCGFQIA